WSAMTPPIRAKSRIGTVEAKPTRPSQKAELVSCSTSQPWATFCIQVPTLERKLPAQKSRKSRWRSALKMRGSSIAVVAVGSLRAPPAPLLPSRFGSLVGDRPAPLSLIVFLPSTSDEPLDTHTSARKSPALGIPSSIVFATVQFSPFDCF